MADRAQIFFSTKQNVVNVFPLLMEQFSGCTPIIISSEVAIKSHWTANLELVLQRRGLCPQKVDISSGGEYSPASVRQLSKILSGYDEVYFNISGGKKNQILLLLEVYNLRAIPQDRIIYADNEPFTVEVYAGNRKEAVYPIGLSLDIEDVLNLYGATGFQKPNIPTFTRLTDISDNAVWGSVAKLNQAYLNNGDFARMLYRYFSKIPTSLDDKAKLRDKLERIIKDNRPSLEACKIHLDKQTETEYARIFEEIDKLKADNPNGRIETRELYLLWRKWLRLSNQAEIYQKYWTQMKLTLVDLLQKSVERDDKELFIDKLQIQEIVTICDEITGKHTIVPDILRQSDIKELLDMGVKHGDLFENMFIDRIKHICGQVPEAEANSFYLSLKVYRLGYREDGSAYYPAHGEEESLVEFDVVFVTKHGAMISFECKTFGFFGDVVKAKDQSAHSHGGVFSRPVLVTHLQKQHLGDSGFGGYIPVNVRTQLEAVAKYNLEVWYFDEIEDKLKHLLT